MPSSGEEKKGAKQAKDEQKNEGEMKGGKESEEEEEDDSQAMEIAEANGLP